MWPITYNLSDEFEYLWELFWVIYGIIAMLAMAIILLLAIYVSITDPSGKKYRTKHGIKEETAD